MPVTSAESDSICCYEYNFTLIGLICINRFTPTLLAIKATLLKNTSIVVVGPYMVQFYLKLPSNLCTCIEDHNLPLCENSNNENVLLSLGQNLIYVL